MVHLHPIVNVLSPTVNECAASHEPKVVMMSADAFFAAIRLKLNTATAKTNFLIEVTPLYRFVSTFVAPRNNKFRGKPTTHHN